MAKIQNEFEMNDNVKRNFTDLSFPSNYITFRINWWEIIVLRNKRSVKYM